LIAVAAASVNLFGYLTLAFLCFDSQMASNAAQTHIRAPECEQNLTMGGGLVLCARGHRNGSEREVLAECVDRHGAPLRSHYLRGGEPRTENGGGMVSGEEPCVARRHQRAHRVEVFDRCRRVRAERSCERVQNGVVCGRA